MPQVSIRHVTEYRYRTKVAFGEHRFMARPLESVDQRLIAFEVEVSPEPAFLRQMETASGALVSVARFDGRSETLRFESRALIDHDPIPPQHLHDDDTTFADGVSAYHADEASQLAPFLSRRHDDGSGRLEAWARRFVRPVGRTTLATLLSDMTHAVRREFTYNLRLQGAPQTPGQTLESRTGSCRDYAMLMVEAARSLGLAAQFVSGYVYSASRKSGRTGGGHTHAWARVYLPQAGWFDFDPTNGLIGSMDLIRVAAVAEPRQAIPLHGTWAGMKGAYEGMDVEVAIQTLETEAAQPNSNLRVADRLG